jgi:hypothetical protein
MKTIHVWDPRLPDLPAASLAVPDATAVDLVQRGVVSAGDVTDPDGASAGTGLSMILVWDPRLPNSPPATLIVLSATAADLVQRGIINPANVVSVDPAPVGKAGMLDFSDPDQSGLI